MYQDLGIPMKIEMQSDSSTANSLTDRLGAGQRTKHIDTRHFWIQERVQDGDFSFKKVPTYSEELCRCWNEAHTPLQDEGDDAYDGSGEGTEAVL